MTKAKKPSRTKTVVRQDKKRQMLKVAGAIAAILLLLLLVFLVWCQLRPLNTASLSSIYNPYDDYVLADQAAEALVAADKTNRDLNPDCSYRYLKQPARVERVLVIRHGLTNCPRQFDELAKIYHDMGYAVLITRVPEHGMRDRMAPTFSRLTAEDTLRDLNHSIDIAAGLGEDIDIMGLSAGANEAAYVVTERDDIHQAIIIDPIFTPTGVPAPLTRLVTGALLSIPNQFVWWSDKQKNLDGPTSAYFGWQSQPVGQYLRITEALFEKGRNPRSTHVVVITNENDAAVNNDTTDALARQWRNNGVDVSAYRFPKSENLNHDLIDPLQVGANTTLSYPVIIELSTKNYAQHTHH
ncbi:hypothetical protein IT415_02750 [bacterium]|nr:hypothetical protein [bacterium]